MLGHREILRQGDPAKSGQKTRVYSLFGEKEFFLLKLEHDLLPLVPKSDSFFHLFLLF